MANRNDCDVLVVGGGNVGAALALALRCQGLAVTLVEPHQPPGLDPAGEPGTGNDNDNDTGNIAVDVGLRVSALGPGSRNVPGPHGRTGGPPARRFGRRHDRTDRRHPCRARQQRHVRPAPAVAAG